MKQKQNWPIVCESAAAAIHQWDSGDVETLESSAMKTSGREEPQPVS